MNVAKSTPKPIEMAMGFALVVAVFRGKQADMTESLTGLKH